MNLIFILMMLAGFAGERDAADANAAACGGDAATCQACCGNDCVSCCGTTVDSCCDTPKPQATVLAASSCCSK
ncbi:MAG: hypothetical protein AAGI46_05900 [Planctomycetota bacterium]